jgi:tetratricopeptide (TPR) repeat protein
MGLFDSLFGSRAPEIRDPDKLKNALFQAVGQGDHKKLERLCRKNRQTVVDSFPGWQQPPETVRNDPVAMQSYAQAIIALAQVFAVRLACPDLLDRLIGTEESNPLLKWQKHLGQAKDLMAELRYADARDLLTNLLIDVRDLKGSGTDKYLPITHGYLGECYFQTRDAEKAVPHFEVALRLCEQIGDKPGVIAYLGNLYEVHRYLGWSEVAAGYAERLAAPLEEQGRTAEAARYRKQAGIVRTGEPRNRVVAVVDGLRYEIDEVGVVEGKRIEFVFERNRITLRPAADLAGKGDELGRQGRYEEALELFRDAARADPFDPHARYLEGYTLLHLQRYPQAVESYEATEELAPGWFHCRSNLWLAQQLALGNLGHDTGVAILVLEDSPFPAGEKISLAEQILSRAPSLAPAHLLLGKCLAQTGRKADAQSAFRQGLACAAEPDVKSRLLVELGALTEDDQQRTSLLREAQALNGNLTATAQATLVLKAFPRRSAVPTHV